MFEKFGEMDLQELNMAAAGLKEEGDWKGLQALAEENGIDIADAQDFMEGETEELASAYSAAFGRVKIQDAESKLPHDMKNVLYGMALVMIEDPAFASLIMQKGKRLEGVIDAMKEEAQKHKVGNMACVCGTDRDLQMRILKYYGGAA